VELRGSVAVVTGGAKRLGAATTLALAGAGADVVVHYRSSEAEARETAAAAAALGVRSTAVKADLGRLAEVETLLERTTREFGRVDVLVANAGAFRRTPLDRISESDWDEMIDGNLRSAFFCVHRFGLWMREHTGGAIVTLADVAGLRPWIGYLPYSIAKAGVITLTRGMARELAPLVRVNAVAPGPILFPDGFDADARRREVARTLLQRQGDPRHVADAVVALIANDYITGAVLPVDGGRGLT
jgi:pteridine reductase